MPTEPEDALRAEDKRAELTLRKAHQVAAWAVKAPMTASFFNKASLLWLWQMQKRVPAVDTCTHQNINNLVLILMDNIATKAHINHQGGTHSRSLMQEAEQLGLWVERHRPSLRAEHISGVKNVQADWLTTQSGACIRHYLRN